jgi:lysosomal acid lipase/cholesteryl ester hydrolase
LISIAGFANELHRVVTEDGYILKLHRILPKNSKFRRGPVLMIHGFLGTAADFVLSGPTTSLAFQLANDGYQVFLGNIRGSKYSMKHQKLDPLSREFWRFSFDEIAMFDLPAIINYVLFLTRQNGIFYVGHNQGATALLALLSSRPEFNAKIHQAHFLAPIAFMDYLHPMLALGEEDFRESVKSFNNYNFKSMADFTKSIVDTYCDDKTPRGPKYCVRLWEFVFGRNRLENEIDPKILLQIPEFISPTASVRQYLHFLQIHRSGKFQAYRPQRARDSSEYVLTNVKVPVYIYHGADDLMVSRLVRIS